MPRNSPNLGRQDQPTRNIDFDLYRKYPQQMAESLQQRLTKYIDNGQSQSVTFDSVFQGDSLLFEYRFVEMACSLYNVQSFFGQAEHEERVSFVCNYVGLVCSLLQRFVVYGRTWGRLNPQTTTVAGEQGQTTQTGSESWTSDPASTAKSWARRLSCTARSWGSSRVIGCECTNCFSGTF